MIIVNMACGLANRMFQYSYYLYLKKLGYDVYVDFYTAARIKHENVSWQKVFPNAPVRQASSWDVFRSGGGSSLLSRIRRRYLPKTCCMMYMPSAFDALLPNRDKRLLYVNGVFQNAQMVDSVKNDVYDAFTFIPFTDDYNLSLMEEIGSCQSVAIHVRKGNDYMSRTYYVNTCPVEYYRKAVDLMCAKLQSPRFYVFTDNHEWVRHNFSFFDYKLVDNNPSFGYGSHFDMQLMSLCRHNIISNSTYSWWGAFLNRSNDKIVIAPEEWFRPGSCEEYKSGRVVCEGWLAL